MIFIDLLATAATINMTAAMADVGADAVMVVTPSYFKSKMTGASLVEHYSKVIQMIHSYKNELSYHLL